MGKNVQLIDSGRETALYAANILQKNNLLNKSSKLGKSSYYVSDTVDDFSRLAGLFLGRNVNNSVTHIDIELQQYSISC